MKQLRMLVAFVLVLLSGQGATAQTLAGEDMDALIGLIRQEKFDLILPEVMRSNGIDMWVHVMRAGNPDPLYPPIDRVYLIR